jgi:hypothetical protein
MVQPLFNRMALAAPALGLVTASVALLVYWPARGNGLVWDDWAVLESLVGLDAPASRWGALLQPPADYAALFRPLTMLTFVLQLWAGHASPLPFHTFSIVLHSINVFLVALVAWQLLGDGYPGRPATAAVCALAYALHPALTEPVIWISARSDLIMTFCLCMALLADRLLPARGWSRPLAVGAAFLAAMLAKEPAVALIVMLPVVHLAVDRQSNATRQGPWLTALLPHRGVYAALLGALLLYLGARLAAAGPTLGLDEAVSPASHIATPGQHVLAVIASFAQQLTNVIWPFQSIVPGRHLPLPVDGMQILPMAAAGAALIAAAFLASRAAGAGRLPGLLFLAFIAGLVPVVNIVPIPAVAAPDELAVGSRYLTFPLLFACMAAVLAVRAAAASLVRHAGCRQVLLGAIAAAWMLASVANVRAVIPLWKDDAIMNAWALAEGGPSAWRYANYGVYFVRSGDLRRARDAFATAIGLRDDKQTAWIWDNLGTVEARLGNRQEALRAFHRALELAPDNAGARVRLAMVQRASGSSGAAAANLEQGLKQMSESGRRHPEESRMRYELGLAYEDLGRNADAVSQWKLALVRARRPGERRAIEEAMNKLRP